MTYTGPNTQCVSSSSHALASGTYQADFNRFKEDLIGVLKSKLEIDMGGSRLYQKSYPPEFDFISYPAGWRVPEFVKFNGEDSRTTWEHVSHHHIRGRKDQGRQYTTDWEHTNLVQLSRRHRSDWSPMTCQNGLSRDRCDLFLRSLNTA